jgi:uncharacterized protein (TIGR03790 family)
MSTITLTKDNVLFAYNVSDADSYNVALRYKFVHKLDDSQLVPLDCSSNEILGSYSEFQLEVENDIKSAIAASVTTIYVVVLGYNVPGGFLDNGDVISSTSRISRVFQTYDKKRPNPLYNRQVNKLYLDTDYPKVIIASRIDAPSVDLAIKMIGSSSEFINQYYVNGRFYFDPYSDLHGYQPDIYTEDLLDFYNNLLFDLNLEVSSTVLQDAYIDVVTPYLQHDSFYWGWLTDRTTLSFFKNTDTARVFFYNADFDSAYTIRSTSNGNFSPLAVSSGYVATAGAMSYPEIDGFLRPRSFFASLVSGATIGEAFLFACPYLDWTVALFGDPLAKVFFIEHNDSTAVQPVPVDESEIWRELSVSAAKMKARFYNKEIEAVLLRDNIVASLDISTEVDMLYKMQDLVKDTETFTRDSRFKRLIGEIFEYAVVDLVPKINAANNTYLVTLDQFMAFTGYKVSELLLDGFAVGTMSSSYFYNEGYWEFDTDIADETGDVAVYQFELQVSDDSSFSNILFNFDSSVDTANWYYEKEENEFVSIPSIGVASSYIGRRIKYVSDSTQYLTRGQVYYYRILQKIGAVKYGYRDYNQVIFT